ncbi:hypothetical protein PPEP_b0833 [Pseudoalteromonas peptidolytica F12-50-A1]|uniref:Uncharacterized protein n=1 Tax=Pseudoalteromonas peptidolytica F12-50-A1 TaxID=1315280 RepID=A0A8I0T5X8_9GAMM|nr:hypothetical protein [Pseudoalteromonas peptidolytica F12-50-A1]
MSWRFGVKNTFTTQAQVYFIWPALNYTELGAISKLSRPELHHQTIELRYPTNKEP